MIQTKQKPFLWVCSEAAHCARTCEECQDESKQWGIFCFVVREEEIGLEAARAAMCRGVISDSIILLSRCTCASY